MRSPRSHLARLAFAISKWLRSIFIVNFSLCMYLSIVNFSGHEIKIVVVVVVVVVASLYATSCKKQRT